MEPLHWLDDRRLRVADHEFLLTLGRGTSRSDRFVVRKSQAMIDDYVELFSERAASRLLEIGIADGGSAALLHTWLQPDKLVTVDINPDPVPALEQLAQEAGGSLKTYWGVDQADRDRLSAIVEDEFGDDRIDVVIDDASHLLDQTRSSFEVIFPRVATDGVYLIEDWCSHLQHAAAHSALLADTSSEQSRYLLDYVVDAVGNPDSEGHLEARVWLTRGLRDPASPHQIACDTIRARLDPDIRAEIDEDVRLGRTPESITAPLPRFAFELILANAATPDVISEVRVNQWWITAKRGPRPLAQPFSLSDLYHDHLELLR